MTDPYKVLGISPNATDDEVKKHTESLRESTIRITTAIPILPKWRERR